VKPILFSTPMVQAILNGTKTQTRRIFKTYNKGGLKLEGHQIEPGEAQYFSPYGKVGDILWVRETFLVGRVSVGELPDGRDSEPYVSQCSDENDIIPYEWCIRNDIDVSEARKKPSIFMPKAACRLFLKITDIRVERLQDISVNDIIKEGLSSKLREHDACVDLKDKWEGLWKSINGEQSWNDNPWVWVVEFEQTEKPDLIQR
jgi:hypothetical protein